MHELEFESFFKSHEFAHFTAKELLYKGADHSDLDKDGYGLNTDPPPELWSFIIPTVMVLEWLRRDIGEAIFITSAYRAPEYNKVVGGSTDSQHMRFCACDIHAASKPHDILYQRLKWARADGVFKGGLGLYSWGVHVDTRGINKDW
ncbi:D-Ala-D-Ala carboxypeptidase family metallohydrolase [Cohaesibacter marisflavi]|uniref:D-Ala-D-Ala carboxypeptidase family metallohydrolase n=1 Tax=Cohaesibacter marisflavi TaxID=655353 RepID=UPI0029C775AE|nr:D-Ala-D-Ala carboxypeptidase family metallohydrolase [Cohaesibacter marisflavi]